MCYVHRKEKKKTVLKGDLSTFCMNNLHLSSCVALCFRFHDRLFFWYVHTQMNPAGAVHRWRQSIWVESFKFEILLTHHSWWTGTPCISQPCSSTSPRSRHLCSGEKHTQHVSHSNLRSDRNLIKDRHCVHDTCIKIKFSTNILFYSIFCTRHKWLFFFIFKIAISHSCRHAADLKEILCCGFRVVLV